MCAKQIYQYHTHGSSSNIRFLGGRRSRKTLCFVWYVNELQLVSTHIKVKSYKFSHGLCIEIGNFHKSFESFMRKVIWKAVNLVCQSWNGVNVCNFQRRRCHPTIHNSHERSLSTNGCGQLEFQSIVHTLHIRSHGPQYASDLLWLCLCWRNVAECRWLDDKAMEIYKLLNSPSSFTQLHSCIHLTLGACKCVGVCAFFELGATLQA